MESEGDSVMLSSTTSSSYRLGALIIFRKFIRDMASVGVVFNSCVIQRIIVFAGLKTSKRKQRVYNNVTKAMYVMDLNEGLENH